MIINVLFEGKSEFLKKQFLMNGNLDRF